MHSEQSIRQRWLNEHLKSLTWILRETDDLRNATIYFLGPKDLPMSERVHNRLVRMFTFGASKMTKRPAVVEALADYWSKR